MWRVIFIRENGEFIFDSFQEAFNFVKRPTNYERRKNITAIGTNVILNLEDFKVVTRETSDKRTAIFLFFKNSTVYDVWKFWCPSKSQFEILLNVLPYILNNVDKKNAILAKKNEPNI